MTLNMVAMSIITMKMTTKWNIYTLYIYMYMLLMTTIMLVMLMMATMTMLLLFHLSRGWVIKADEAKALALVGRPVDKHLPPFFLSLLYDDKHDFYDPLPTMIL